MALITVNLQRYAKVERSLDIRESTPDGKRACSIGHLIVISRVFMVIVWVNYYMFSVIV